MNQQMLDELVGTPPRSTVDVDRIIARQRRRARLRRVAAGGSAAVAVALAISVGVSAAGGRPPEAPTLPVAAPSPAGFIVRDGTKADQQNTLTWLRTTLEQATAEYAPDAKWIYMPDVPGEKPGPDGHPKMWTNHDPVTFEARSGLIAAGHKGGFYLSVHPTGCVAGQSCMPTASCADAPPDCAGATTPGGLRAIRWVDKPGRKWLFYGTTISLRGGKWTLVVQAVNYFGGDGSPAAAPVPPLTRDQVDAIAGHLADQITG
jgi:hypothetical protein